MKRMKRLKRWREKLNLRVIAARLRAALRKRGGAIAYYACVALALAAIAVAAERYRGEKKAAEEGAALPAVEFSAPEEEREEEKPAIPESWAILRGYAEAPAWNAALGLWECHPAMDLRPDGAVACLCAGTVRGVGKSGALGGYVEVESGELRMRYASISPREGLEPGDELEIGDAIGTADASLPGEANLGPHLHLEAWLDGRPVDFAALADGD